MMTLVKYLSNIINNIKLLKNLTINNKYNETMNKKENIYSHFLQKAFVKNFASNGKLKYIKYPNGKLDSFNINDSNSKQPIVKKNFYSMHIEKEMNNLESKGIAIIRKIAYKAQYDYEISLNRRELITLKFYVLLSGVRTQKIRNNILNKDGDSQFNKIMREAKDTPRNIQEKMISCILTYWKSNKNYLIDNILANILRYKNDNDKIMELSLNKIFNIIQSRLIIFKFETNNLLLTEALSITEQNSAAMSGILLQFMPIYINVGIAFYFDCPIKRNLSVPQEKSKIFKNDISIIRNKNEYIKVESIKITQKIQKQLHKNDRYIYKVLNEPKETAIFCNAMALVHCEDSYVIFQNKKDIEDAKKCIKEKGIYRIEDIQ